MSFSMNIRDELKPWIDTVEEYELDMTGFTEEPYGSCPYCDMPMSSEKLYYLHIGERHSDEFSDGEKEEYQEMKKMEADDLFVFHIKMVVALFLAYFGFSMVYAFIWST